MIKEIIGLDKINIFGVCFGGIMIVMFVSFLVVVGDDWINLLIF